jgi:hypothetical protein
LVIELIDWLRTAREELTAMTEDRDLWRYDHEGDCPVQAALEAEREARKQAEDERFNAGWNGAVEEIAEKAPYMRLFRLRESIRANLRPPPEPRKVVTQDDIDRIDAEEGPNRAVVKGRSNRFGDSHD